jgi:hypothetical protein
MLLEALLDVGMGYFRSRLNRQLPYTVDGRPVTRPEP